MSTGHRRFPLLLFLFALCGALYYFREPILVRAAQFLVVDEPLQKSDAIFVLSGEFPSRILEAADLYREGYAPTIYLSKDEEPLAYQELRKRKIGSEIAPSGNDLNLRILVALGVPREKIILPSEFMKRTVDEAKYVATILRNQNEVHDLIVVTSPAHTGRAKRLLLDAFSGAEVRVHMRASRYEKIEVNRWWKDNLQRRAVGHEWLAMLASPFLK